MRPDCRQLREAEGPRLPLRRGVFPHQPGQGPLHQLAARRVGQAGGAVGGADRGAPDLQGRRGGGLRDGGQVRGDGLRSGRGGGVAVPAAPGPEGGPVAQVGAPRVLAEAGREGPAHALRVGGGQRGRGGGLRRLRGQRMSHNCDYRTLWRRRAAADLAVSY